ncbi:MmcQ/YjbR family DNA-binding protein [Peribacillus glennii]|uniref:MmcQ/YjbR family DNA-binding protein n=1 Tax=Peribacillus glennii TaxID=2303991 RepID=A0A372LG62_9BACI|nr:MmcQ/YjbR family DNA-binding protein [Peribacillus glennii]RFU65295.1 MmcQ/YjbR family DNA-binding protein [Peribacillus glennii]
MHLQRLGEFCLQKKSAIEDFTFGDDIHVMKIGGKMFALISESDSRVSITLKCQPEISEHLHEQNPAVKTGYHMNKVHWNTLEIDGSIPEEMINELVDRPYRLVLKGLKKAERDRSQNA